LRRWRSKLSSLLLPIKCAHDCNRTDGAQASSHQWSISRCSFHHVQQHQIGESAFEVKYEIGLKELAREFAMRSPGRPALLEPGRVDR
jgi:hypothetical protein